MVTGFCHVFSPDGLKNILFSQGCVLKNDYDCENGGQTVRFKDGKMKSLWLPVSKSQVNSSCLLDDLLQQDKVLPKVI